VLIWILYAGFSWWNLGHYALWDDEANTALFAQSVWETGDTSARRGENLIAFRNGSELNEDWKARYVSPLQYYVAAPFLGLMGATSLAARIPFWIFGTLAFALILHRLFKQNASPFVFWLWTIGWFGTISLTLYIRNARYYSLTLPFSLFFADIWTFSTKESYYKNVLLGLASALTFVSNYLNGIALVATFFMHQLLESVSVNSFWTPSGLKLGCLSQGTTLLMSHLGRGFVSVPPNQPRLIVLTLKLMPRQAEFFHGIKGLEP
jgi:hypothetical protein